MSKLQCTCSYIYYTYIYIYILYFENSANEMILILLMTTLGFKTPKMKNCLQQTAFTTPLDPRDHLDSVQFKIPTQLTVYSALYKEYS